MTISAELADMIIFAELYEESRRFASGEGKVKP